MRYIPFALEMFSVREDFSRNPLETMKAVKAMGYEGVEFAGPAQFTPDFYAALLKETGLVCCGWHTPLEYVLGDKLEGTIRLNQAVGNKYIIVPWLKFDTLAEWKAHSELLNSIADELAKYGMRIGFHNHPHEFKEIEGRTPWAVFMEAFSPHNIMQLDTGNTVEGGADIMAELEKHPGRCATIHLKPWSKSKGAEPVIGEDDCPWEDIFRFCLDKGATEWFIIEYECPAIPALEAVDKCLKGAKNIFNAIRN